MTKKHYIMAAKIIRESNLSNKDEIIELFIKFFERDNAAFKSKLFLLACEPNGQYILL